jgi:hypothetical protein
MPVCSTLNTVTHYSGIEYLIYRLSLCGYAVPLTPSLTIPVCSTLNTVFHYAGMQYLKQRLSLFRYEVP